MRVVFLSQMSPLEQVLGKEVECLWRDFTSIGCHGVPGHGSVCATLSDFILMSCIGGLETECSCPVLAGRGRERETGRERRYRKDRDKSNREKGEGWRRREAEERFERY